MKGQAMLAYLCRTHCVLLLVLFIAFAARAQSEDNGSPDQTQPSPEGFEGGGYIIHQSAEIGYRANDVTGSEAMYNTIVNLNSGPRVLDESLSVQSKDENGLLFDNLFVDGFGWGGDPETGLNVRVDKSVWYDFRASFRRDQNFFNFDLLANPLNPPTSSPSIPVTSSPHNFLNSHRMNNLDLTVLPQSVVTFRIGYSYNVMDGPSYSTDHEGTDALLLQMWNTTMNSYRFGVDFKVSPRTVISYDQFLDYYDGKTTRQLASFAPALLPGIPGSVELGLPIDTNNGNPCAVVPPATSLIDATGTLTNVDCNGFYAYSRPDHIHTFTPTERVSLHSSYFSWLDFSASYAYSSADMTSPENEFFNGFSARSDLRQETVTGTGKATQISNVADFSATFHLSKHIRAVDTLRFWSYRIPQSFASNTTDWDAPSTPLPGCSAPSLLTPISCTVESTPSTALTQTSFNQRLTKNQTELIWDISPRIGLHGGFRYADQRFDTFDFIAGTQDRIVVHEYTGLAGFWARPTANTRINFDWEHSSYDNIIVRIGPRAESRYRIQANYKPKPWAVLAGSINLWQSSNDDVLTNFLGHSYNYGLTASLIPRERFSFQLAYNFNDYQQSAFVCFNDADSALPVVIDAGSCTANGYNDSKNNLLTNGYYTSGTNYGMVSVIFKPFHRISAELGYSISSVEGRTPQFNVLQPGGSTQYNYQQPVASLAYEIGHKLTAKAAWNYYQYGEQSFVGPTDPRYFHANNATLSLRWDF
jgi:hypothetical protein